MLSGGHIDVSVSTMLSIHLAVFCILLKTCMAQEFPSSFKFGAATAAYQIEGAWKMDGKGASIWDRYVRTNAIADNTTGDVAGDSYHLWREDVRLVAQLGLHYYRFSISWPRILPSGLPNKISKAGAKYYSDLIDELLRRGIEPVVTMYHFDLPVKLQDLGGWTNPLISDWFEDYARVLYSLYADRVKTWLTINEAVVVCDLSYNTATWAPGIKEMDLAPFICNKNIMMAHAKAYRLYEREYKDKYKGRISLANNLLWIDPIDSSPAAIELAELGLEHMVGRYSHPIFSKEGGWPQRIEKRLLEHSLQEGYSKSKLPSFTEEEKVFVRGTADFYGLNYYTARVIRPARDGESGEWFLDGSLELHATLEPPPESKPTASSIMPMYPIGLRKMLSYIKKTYGNIEILITENGYAGKKDFRDYMRVQFIRDHLEQVLLSINEDQVPVIGYTYWSLFDTFEWASGYSVLFGIYDMDYTDPERPRTPRLSSRYYKCVVKSKSLNVSEKCTHNSVISQLGFQIPNTATTFSINQVILIFITFLFSYV